jgi:hypothetical protein
VSDRADNAVPSNLTDVWDVPSTPMPWWWAAQLFVLCMLALAMLWLASWVHDLWWLQQPLTLGHAVVALSLLLWLPWARHWWCAAPPTNKFERLHWVPANKVESQSPWQTPKGEPVQVRVLLDAGSHLLLGLSSHGLGTACCLVNERDLPGPWRWRMLAGQPRPQARPVKADQPKRRTWHHPQP